MPTVATIAIGPAAGGAVRGDRRSSASASISNRSLVGTLTSAARPRPSVMHAFSIELCASVGGVDARPADVRARREPLRGGVEARRLARGGEGDERRRRRGVGQQAVERVGQPERLAQPADDDALELGPDRRRPPQHRVLAERRRSRISPSIPGPDAVVAK